MVANTRKINDFIIQKGKNSKPIGNLDCSIFMKNKRLWLQTIKILFLLVTGIPIAEWLRYD